MNSPQNQVMGRAEWLLMGVLAIIWGGSFFFGKVAVKELPPFSIVFCRVGLAALALHLVLIATGRRMPASLKTWSHFLVMGALNNMVPFSLIFWGQIRIASGLAAILNATTPLWTVLLAHLLTRDEKLTWGRLGGVFMGIAGVVVIIGPDALQGFGAHVWSQLAVVGATVCYALAGIFGKRFRELSPCVTATGQLTGSTLIMLPFTLLVDKPWLMAMPGWRTWGSVVALALICSALAYLIYFRILAAAGATNIVLVTFLIPISALLLGTLILGERLALRHLAGMAAIAGGLAVIDGRWGKLAARGWSKVLRGVWRKSRSGQGQCEDYSI